MYNFNDAQQVSLNFLRNQLSIIEPSVYRIIYPDVQYPDLVPVVSDGWEWAKSILYTSLDSVARAQWFHSQARDVPVAEVVMEQFETTVEMAALGYRYGVEELATAARLGVNLGNEKAIAVRRGVEEFIDDAVLRGDTVKAWKGLINNDSVVTIIDAADEGDLNGGTNSPYWIHKTPQQIMDDFNLALVNIFQDSLTIEMADTVLLPLDEMTRLSQMQLTSTLDMTVLEWLQKHNMYTQQTGQPLTIKAIRGLEAADAAGGGRMVAYRRAPDVLKFHMPMPFRFLPAQPENAVGLVFIVPGIFRIGQLEIRRPQAMRYVDGIAAVPA